MSDQKSIIELSKFTSAQITDLFQKCLQLKKNFSKNLKTTPPLNGTATLLFFEPSTRTRFSFESAAVRAGVYPLVFSGSSGTSLEKGETMEDTIMNLEAMRPLFFVIRAPDSLNFYDIQKKISVPILNAGWGLRAHPTQALLDMVTLFERWQSVKNKKVLFVGDIRHSRVVNSHIELSEIMGYQIGYCGPQSFLPENISTDSSQKKIEMFTDLKKGLKWADAVVALRVQKERHSGQSLTVQDYREHYGLNPQSLENLKSDALIMHPGPINYGVELEESVLQDQRSVILKMVENGVFMREALIREVLESIK